VRVNLELSSKPRKREEELKFKAGETLITKVITEQHANLIKNKSRNVSEL